MDKKIVIAAIEYAVHLGCAIILTKAAKPAIDKVFGLDTEKKPKPTIPSEDITEEEVNEK